MAGKRYILTARAAADLRAARAWSLARWGKGLTDKYFEDMHKGAELIAQTLDTARRHHELAGDTGLLLRPVREHYIVYEPVGPQFIAIVAVIRQSRDIPSILRKWAAPIRHELAGVREKVARREIKVSRATRAVSRRKASSSSPGRRGRK